MGDVREYLSAFREKLKENAFMLEQIGKLEAECKSAGLTARLDGMPKARRNGGAKDSHLIELADLTTEYDKNVQEASRMGVDLFRFINGIPNLKYRQVLFTLYVDGVPVEDLPEVLGKSKSWCAYTRKGALAEAEKLYSEMSQN